MSSSSDEDIRIGPTIQGSNKMTPEIEQLLGQANQYFVFHQFDEAYAILKDVITKAPCLPDPYHVLGLIHEERREHDKAVNFFMLAAQMTQHDSELWSKVAHMHKDFGHFKEAVYCFSRALQNKKGPDIELMKEKAVCYEKIGDYRKAGKTYFKILQVSDPCDPTVAKALVEVYNILAQPSKAISSLQEILEEKYDPNLVNLLCDLHIQISNYQFCIDYLDKFSDQEFPIDIQTKLGYCLARVGRVQEADFCFEKLLEQSVKHFPDLYYLIGCLYQDLGFPEKSLQFLEQLRQVDSYDKPILWLACGKLYKEIEDYSSAEDALNLVLSSNEVGLHIEARVCLSKIYKTKGEIERSMEILQTTDIPYIDTSELTSGFLDSFIAKAKLKIEEAFIQIQIPATLQFMHQMIDIQLKLEISNKTGIISEIGEEVFVRLIEKIISDLESEESFYKELKELINRLLKLEMYRKDRRLRMKKTLAKICIKDQDYEQAISAYKFICEKEDRGNNWAVLSCLLKKSSSTQLRTWLSKLNAKFPDHYAVHMLLGNNYLQTGYFSHAIKQYSYLYAQDPEDSLVNLNLGLCYLFSLSSRNLQKKEDYYEKAMQYLKNYSRIRKKTDYAEANYNIGRAFQHINFLTRATHYYEKVLMSYSRNLSYGLSLTKKTEKYSNLSARNLYEIRKLLKDDEGAQQIYENWLEK
ncbi:GTF3C3 [Blepharisma stoltei]|uniref:Uncharacterized protein n=1 Tax=Blepharisma stoltei TaxID=1481888 RepID=A0AAU9JB75_9CILI|nr:unnamed protein product [Blepharisma stoltei]